MQSSLSTNWLEETPVLTDWVQKTLQIKTVTGIIQLQGHRAAKISAAALTAMRRQQTVASPIHVYALHETMHTEEITPEQLLQPLLAFSPNKPSSLPPRRDCDHRIPLMSTAQPVIQRAYMNKPELKTKIKRLVAELLPSGVIQRSTNQFSSPTVIFKKKDGTWRLYINYRTLNSITVE
jgi:hypothetical protein